MSEHKKVIVAVLITYVVISFVPSLSLTRVLGKAKGQSS